MVTEFLKQIFFHYDGEEMARPFIQMGSIIFILIRIFIDNLEKEPFGNFQGGQVKYYKSTFCPYFCFYGFGLE